MISYEITGKLVQNWNNVERILIPENGNNLIDKIKNYGKRNNNLFNKIDNSILQSVIQKYCIYDSKTNIVKNYIKKSYEILSNNNLQDCGNCPNINTCPTHNPGIWNDFTSCLLIAYQIRNNVAHLGKLDNNERNMNFINFAFHIFNLIQ